MSTKWCQYYNEHKESKKNVIFVHDCNGQFTNKTRRNLLQLVDVFMCHSGVEAGLIDAETFYLVLRITSSFKGLLNFEFWRWPIDFSTGSVGKCMHFSTASNYENLNWF